MLVFDEEKLERFARAYDSTKQTAMIIVTAVNEDDDGNDDSDSSEGNNGNEGILSKARHTRSPIHDEPKISENSNGSRNNTLADLFWPPRQVLFRTDKFEATVAGVQDITTKHVAGGRHFYDVGAISPATFIVMKIG